MYTYFNIYMCMYTYEICTYFGFLHISTTFHLDSQFHLTSDSLYHIIRPVLSSCLCSLMQIDSFCQTTKPPRVCVCVCEWEFVYPTYIYHLHIFIKAQSHLRKGKKKKSTQIGKMSYHLPPALPLPLSLHQLWLVSIHVLMRPLKK